ncbi:MAG: leucine-rich repeat domain-containing protein, partial [Kiritimatiellae bacterium]|nr:leucine-rich repeat domain-containing protein [Kiritimatiellia bacterium]
MKTATCATLMAALVVAGLPFASSAASDGPWSFSLADGEATLTGYSGTGPENLELPSSVESDGTSYPVTAIGSSAFGGKSWFKTVSIPETVRSIAARAFDSCNGLLDVLVPASVTNLADTVFHSCTAITNAVILAQADVIDLGMFPTQSPITNIVVAGNGRTTLRHSYGGYAQRAFLVELSGVAALGEDCFGNFPNLTNVVFRDDMLRDIGRSAFSSASNLLSIDIPASVTNIGSSAFWSCESLTNAVIGGGVRTVGSDAFSYCRALLGIEMPSSVTNIGSSAFANCNSIREVVWNGGDGTIDGGIFGGQTNWVSLVIRGNGNTAVKGFNEKAVQNVRISGVSEILSEAFRSCSQLKTFVIEDECLGDIGRSAFSSASNLLSIDIPASVTNIGSSAFWSCTSLGGVVFRRQEVPTVGGGAFSYVPSTAVFYNYEGATGYDVSVYPWDSFSLKTLMADGTVGISGAINASETWSAGVPYQILAPTRVRGSSTVLTIGAGVEVRFAEGASLAVENSGTIVAAGERENPVVFTSAAETKAPGDWEYVGGSSGRIDLTYTTVEYGGGKTGAGAVYGCGATITMAGTTVQNAANAALCGYGVYATNCVLRASDAGIGEGPWRLDLVNSVIDDCGTAVAGSNRNIYNTIIANCGSFGTSGTFSYCLFDQACEYTAAKYDRHNVAGEAKFLDGTFYEVAADSPAVDAASGGFAPEADYFGSVRMASTNDAV